MTVPQELLQRLAGTLRIARVDPPLAPLGQFMRFGIAPQSSFLRVVDPDLITRNLAMALNGTLTGNVTSPANTISGSITNLTGGLPGTIQAATAPVTQDISGTIDPNGPRSLIESFPIPVEVPVQLTVTWGAYRYVRRPSDPSPGDLGPITDFEPRLRPSTSRLGDRFDLGADPISEGLAPIVDAPIALRQREELVAGEDFLTPDGVDVTDIAFLFAPPFGELTVEGPDLVSIYVYASVTLSVVDPLLTNADPVSYGPVELPAVRVLLPVLPIPKLLALFRHHDFNGATDNGVPRARPATLLVVPADSPLGTYEELRPILEALRTILGSLRSIGRFARLLLGVNLLGSALSRRPALSFVVGDRINDLHDIRLFRLAAWQDPYVNDQIQGWLDRAVYDGIPHIGPSLGVVGRNRDNDIYAGDEMSSLIFLAPPGTAVACFNNENCEESEGKLIVTTSVEGIVMIRSLRYPGSENVVIVFPRGNTTVGDGFDDVISSISYLPSDVSP